MPSMHEKIWNCDKEGLQSFLSKYDLDFYISKMAVKYSYNKDFILNTILSVFMNNKQQVLKYLGLRKL